MYLIETDDQAARELIAAIAEHVPAGATLGRLRVATGDTILADGLWGIDQAGAWRLVDLAGAEAELTRWHAGREISRRIIDTSTPLTGNDE